MEILTRDEFKRWMVREFDDPGIAAPKSALWIPEDRTGLRCQYFVLAEGRRRRYQTWSELHDEYWTWCTETLAGDVRCFWANNESGEEWWGFTEQDDIPIWILKWAA